MNKRLVRPGDADYLSFFIDILVLTLAKTDGIRRHIG